MVYSYHRSLTMLWHNPWGIYGQGNNEKERMFMRTRIVVSAILVFLYFVAMSIYGAMQGPIEAKIAVGQLSDSTVQYSVARTGAMGAIPKIALILLVAGIAATWLPVIIRSVSSHYGMMTLVFLLGSGTFVACGPYQKEIVEEIGPNETAFLVPLEGESKEGQAKFMSVDYLNKAKVATKRVTIPTRQRNLGRTLGNYEWIPVVKLIKVDRTPVTRIWTQGKETGTTPSNQAICVESKESIDFCVGVIVLGAVTESDAATFLYQYSGKKLADVMDQDVRGYIGSVLSREFGARTLEQGRTEKNHIFYLAHEETVDFFATNGVTIRKVGSTEGMQYRDQKIQEAINATFVAENDKNTAENQRQAQAKRNELNVAKAIAEREAAEEFAKAEKAQIAIRELEIRTIQAQATLEAARKWNGQMPASIMPQGTNLLFGLDQSTKK